MSLPEGTRLGPYEILAPVGAGGMGEVYRARDTRLGREVAVKVLASRLTEDPDLKRRFEREAKAISHLSHPHICALFDVGSHSGIDYLVMELLEGQSLAARLESGALPMDRVLKVGAEIAEALAAAHRKGIIHRDLKPGNVMLTKAGVKLLDFGLAKAIAPSPSPDASMLQTKMAASRPLTEKGTILGTFHYMAPEQLEGRDADARTDIFALGCLLYETITARKAFSGDSRASLIGSILKDDPIPIAATAPMTPPALDRLVRRSLAKDPDERWQSAADIASELRWIAEGSSRVGEPETIIAHPRIREQIAWALAAVAGGLAALAFGLLSSRQTSASARALRATVESPPGISLDATDASLALSPDGRFLALAADDAGQNRLLYLRAMDSDLIRPLPGTEDAISPFWSPDGNSIGFFSAQKLKRIEIGNGAVREICDAPKGRGGTWGPGGIIIFSRDASGRLYRVAAAGGAASPLEPELERGVLHRNPHVLPGGSVLFSALTSMGTAEKGICVLDPASKKIHPILPVASEAYYISPGLIAYLLDGSVVLQPFDAKNARVAGQPVPVAENVARYKPRGTGQFSFAGNDLFVFRSQPPGRPMQLAWFGPDGRKLSNVGDLAPVVQLSLAPDGKRAAEVIGNVNEHQIWLMDLGRGVRTRFTFDVDNAVNPVWSRDGHRLAYNARSGGKGSIQIKSVVGGSPPETVYEGTEVVPVTSWSPDGQELLFQTQSGGTRSWDLWTLPLSGSRKPQPLIATAANEGFGAFSPDGRWLAFWSDESGKTELYVTSYPASGAKWQVSSGGTVDSTATEAFWWIGNDEIDFLSPDWRMLAVRLKLGGETPEISSPRPIRGGISLPASANDFSPAAREFLVAVPSGEPPATPITVVTNWAAALERR